MNALRWLAALLCLAASPAPAETLFINDGTVHTLGSQGVLQRGDLLLRDGRVRAVGRELPVPADAVVIEAAGRPVTPGFFAGVNQLGLVEISAEAPSVDGTLASESPRPEFDVATAFNPDSALLPVTRIEGYSWAMLSPSRGGTIFGGQGRPVSLSGAPGAFLGDSVLFLDIGGDASEQSAGSRASQWMLLEQAFEEAAAETDWTPLPLLTAAGRRAVARTYS